MPKQLSIEKDVYVKLEAKAKEKNLTVPEYISELINENTDSIGITVWVPKNIMELLTAEGFFHKDMHEWFTNAVVQYVEAELNNLDYKIERGIREKYGFNC